jgi:hypothetical protein
MRRIALLFQAEGVIHVVTARNDRAKETKMNLTIETETAKAPETFAADKPRASKKAKRARHSTPVAPKKAHAGKKAKASKKAPKSAKTAKPAKPSGSRDGSKAATILELLKRPGGRRRRN